jgi:hypothetical protein
MPGTRNIGSTCMVAYGGQKARVQVLGAGDIEDKIEILYDIINII